jgi:hypothetical protein
MATKTLAPAVDTVFFGNATRDVQLVVASHTDIVIAGIALETMVTGVDRWDRASTDVAECGEVQGPED